jgi:hypothetical protein
VRLCVHIRQLALDAADLADALGLAHGVGVELGLLLGGRGPALGVGTGRVTLRVGLDLGAGASEGVVLDVGGGRRAGGDLRLDEKEVARDGQLVMSAVPPTVGGA